MGVFTSSIQPLCRYCGGKIKKETSGMHFGAQRNTEGYNAYRVEKPTTLEEAQSLTNLKIVSNKWCRAPEQLKGHPPYIDYVGLWDGVSYVDEFFCSGEHAKALGYLVASNGRCTISYNDALEAQKKALELCEADR